MKDFQLRWGKRRLEDNWRRRNKGFVEFSNDTSEVKDATKSPDADKKNTTDNKTREFYTRQLPTTDSLMAVSHQKVLDSYFNAGMVYYNELKDLLQAVLLYEEMLKRFPDNDYKVPVSYQQYLMYTDLKNNEKASWYKNLILSRYPETIYAKIIMDPEYYKQLLSKSMECDRFYETTYNLYYAGNYSSVIENADTAMVRYKNNPALPKFELLKVLAIGKTNDIMTFRDALNSLISHYPKNEVSIKAKEIIAYLNSYKPETKQQEDIKIAEITYIMEETTTYNFGLVVDKIEDVNQVVFDIINFDLDNYPNDHFEITNEAIGDKYKIIIIKTFPDQIAALKFYNTFTSKPSVLKNVKNATRTMFIISPANLLLLEKQQSVDGYFEFFKKHFLGL
jgi:hypothetical protein